MSDFEKAFNQLSKVGLENHTELWGEPKTERAFFEAGQASKQAEIDELKTQLNNMEACYIQVKKELEDQHKKVDEVLEYLDGESANRWGLWKEKADMLDQGASNAFEEAYWMAKKALRGEHDL